MVHLTITALELTNHGPFRGKHRFELPEDGPAVCIRPNEFGKTTLLESVAAVLWGEAATSKNWSSSEQEPHRGAVEFVRREAEQSCRFRVQRDFQTHQLLAWQLEAEGGRRELFAGTHNPAGRTPDHRRWPNETLPELWAPLSCQAFRHLAMLTQPLPDELDGKLVQQLASGSGSGTTEDAQEVLVQRFRSLSKLSKEAGLSPVNARKNGRLDELEAERDGLCTQLTQAAGDLDRVQGLREQLAQCDETEQVLREDRKGAENSLAVIERYRELKRELDQAAQQAGQLENASREAREAAAATAAAEQRIARLPEGFHGLASDGLLRLREEVDDYRIRRAGLIDPQQLADRGKQLQQQYADVWDWPDDASQRIRRLQVSGEEAGAARQEVEELQRRFDGVRPQPDTVRRRVATAAAGLLAGVAAGVVIGVAANSAPWGVVAGCLAGVAVASTAYSFYQPQKVHPDFERVADELEQANDRLGGLQRAVASARAQIDFSDETNVTRLVRLAERRDTLRRELDERETEEKQQSQLRLELDPGRLPHPLPGLLESCQGNLEEVVKKLNDCQTAQDQHRSAGEKMASLLGTFRCRDRDELDAERQKWQDRRVAVRRDLDLLVKENALAEQLQQMEGAEIETRRSELQQQAENDRKELETLAQRRRGIQRDLDAAQSSVKINVAEAETQLHQLDAEIERLGGDCRAIQQAGALLREAAGRYSAHHRDAIEQRINDLMGAWTGMPGRRFIVAADFSLGLTIEDTNGQEEEVELSVLSQGASDQLALAVRMAVLDRVGADVVLPILIDDAFLTWDEQRRGRLVGALQSAAGGRQFILVSHDAAFDAWGQPITCTRNPA